MNEKIKFDPLKVYIEDSIFPWVSYTGMGRIGIWWFDRKALALDYSFYLMGFVSSRDKLTIPCEKHRIPEIIEYLLK